MKRSKKKSKNEKDPLAGDLSHVFDEPGWMTLSDAYKLKDKTITLRISSDLLNAIKNRAEKEGIDYQKWIRMTLEESLKAS